MAKTHDLNLSRRERQIMNALFQRRQASVIEIAAAIPDPPSDTAVRTLLRILESKGYVLRQKEGRRHLYRPAVSRMRAARAALSTVLGTFFRGSVGDALAAHLADPMTEIDAQELDRLQHLIEQAKRELA